MELNRIGKDNYIYSLKEEDIEINSIVEHHGELYKVYEVEDDQIKTYDGERAFWIDIAMIDRVFTEMRVTNGENTTAIQSS